MGVQAKSGFIDRTLRNLKSGWRSIAGASYDASAASDRPDLPEEDLERVRKRMRECLEGRGGEVSARSRAAAMGHVYLALDPTGRERFLRLMAEEFDVDQNSVDLAIGALRRADGPSERFKAEEGLRRALQAPRLKLLTQFNALPDGVKFLVELRADLLAIADKDAAMLGLERDLKELLTSWFDVGFLELRRITWDTASAALLEKLIAYEAVHAIESWDDLKNRLDSDRRCYGYFHPRMPHEPLIFVEVALVNGLADNVLALLDADAPVVDPESADTAIFYSISNAQKGLVGISFGNFLIKRVAADLAGELKGLKTFSTLSPIPGFAKWLDKTLAQGKPKLLTQSERRSLNLASGRSKGAKGLLKKVLSKTDWIEDENLRHALKSPLMRLCALYLAEERRGDGRTLDPVAHFHLSNGAVMEQLNWLADTSEKGMTQSAGMMINYLYDLDRIEANHEDYTGSRTVNVSSAIRAILKG